FGDVTRRQLTPRFAAVAIAQAPLRPLRLRAPGTERTVVPTRLQRSAAVRTAAAQPLAALRTRVEIDTHRAAALRAEGPHLAHFGHDAKQLLGRRDAALDLRQTVLAERDHAAHHRRLANLIFGRLGLNQPPQLVGDPHHFVNPDAAAVAGVIALIATDRFVERNHGRFGFRN